MNIEAKPEIIDYVSELKKEIASLQAKLDIAREALDELQTGHSTIGSWGTMIVENAIAKIERIGKK
jgi:DNA anti-recombination protein RmuC